MRLSTIKLSGFKSFVDPTTLHLPTNMTGIVGPNGCGKSNIIDAIRWVMGESAASRLRGDSLTDVIFSGSSARRPVSQASVELIFDNSDHTIAGEYAAFNEALGKAAGSQTGERLQPSSAATTVRQEDGKTDVLDGPYADTKEQFAGYFFVEAEDLDGAIAWAKRCPSSKHGAIEIRPVFVAPGNRK